MRIRGYTVVVYDIEMFPNLFYCTLKNTETRQTGHYEISHRRNDLSRIVSFFYNNRTYLFCGYNNIHYDNVLINWLIDNRYYLSNKGWTDICKELFSLSNIIVNSGEGYQDWYKWKYKNWFRTLDLLTMLFSQKLRVSLKAMQMTMQYNNVQEYDGSFDDFIEDRDIGSLAGYNMNDVESTCALLELCRSDIELRLGIEDEYGIHALNKDGVNLGMEILKQEYLKKTGLSWDDIKDLRSPCDVIDLNEIILPVIEYKTPVMQDVLSSLKKQKVSPDRKGYERHFLFDSLEYTVGVGGLHTVNTPEKIIPDKGYIISDVDVASLYPSLIIEYGFYPPHLGKEFLDTYSYIKEERIRAKHNKDRIKDKTLKLALNGLSGNLQNRHSWCYSPKTVMQIRMNGQLLLLMLAEHLVLSGFRILQANTDGLFVLREEARDDEFQAICREWERKTRLVLEEDRFEAFYQFAINDYLAVGEGYKETGDRKLLKKKGLFIDTVSLGKGLSPVIIPEAINAYLADGVPVEETIMSCKDIRKFLMGQKVSREFSIEYNGGLLTHVNRYYASVDGCYIYKCKVNGGHRYAYENMLKDSGVTIANNLDDFKDFPDNINYRYYMKEANKIISKFNNRQLGLFE